MSAIITSNISNPHWQNTVPALMQAGTIYMYCFNLNENVSLLQNFFHLLNNDEKDKAQKYRQPNDRSLYQLGRVTIKLLLSIYNHCAPEEIQIIITKNKKPSFKIVTGLKQPDVAYFNISHSNNILLVAVSKVEVGVDVEEAGKFLYDDVIEKSFTGNEISFVKNSENAAWAFATIWTRKEALLKTTGTGMIDELTELEVLNGINTTALEAFKNKDYSICTFSVNDRYIGSVGYEGAEDKNIKFIRANLSQFV